MPQKFPIALQWTHGLDDQITPHLMSKRRRRAVTLEVHYCVLSEMRLTDLKFAPLALTPENHDSPFKKDIEAARRYVQKVVSAGLRQVLPLLHSDCYLRGLIGRTRQTSLNLRMVSSQSLATCSLASRTTAKLPLTLSARRTLLILLVVYSIVVHRRNA